MSEAEANHNDSEGETEHTNSAWPVVQMFPMRHCKVVHFVRHGEGFHNVAGKKDYSQYKRWDLEDAHLTEHGWEQAHALQKHIAQLPDPLNVEVVIVSPLSRALQTAYCREHLGLHPCDRRGKVSVLQTTYPAVDFSLIETEEDELWKPDSRETHDQIRARGAAFIKWLLARPERCLAVVSHSSFLFYLMQNFGHQVSTTVQGELRRWYENCEMRTVVICDGGGESGGLDPLWFPGGHNLKAHGSDT
ncbi:Phosphoglycerate mutase-like protein [Coccomyxa sp. Obi]|nr:Phosphoglycerate mutase-like protein [Coccomyxa sp. Obi]